MVHDPPSKHEPYHIKERLTTADMKTKTSAYKKQAYTFPIPVGSKLIKFLLWFDQNRQYWQRGADLYNAVQDNFQDYVKAAAHTDNKWTTRVFRCFRASEFIFRYKEWEVIVRNKMNQEDDVEPENPMQHTNVDTTLKAYANAASVAHLGAEARVKANKQKVSLDPTGLTRSVTELR